MSLLPILSPISRFALRLLVVAFVSGNTAFAKNAENSDGRRLEHDFNGDGFADILTLSDAERSGSNTFHSVRVFLTAGSPIPAQGYENNRLVTRLSSQAGAGSRLHLARSGDLIIVTYNEAFGRERWNYQRKFSFVGDEFVLSQVTWQSRDNLNPTDRYECRLLIDQQRALINGKRYEIPSYLIGLTLREVPASSLGSPHELCRNIASGKMQTSLLAFRLFQGYRSRLAKALGSGRQIADVEVHSGDLNNDGLSDAVVSFALTDKNLPAKVYRREAAIYQNNGENLKVIGAFPDTDCQNKVSGITGGKIVTERVTCWLTSPN